jgi:hypothetical protein
MKGNRKRIALKDVLKRELKDPEFSFYYQREKAIGEIAQLVRDARLRKPSTIVASIAEGKNVATACHPASSAKFI